MSNDDVIREATRQMRLAGDVSAAFAIEQTLARLRVEVMCWEEAAQREVDLLDPAKPKASIAALHACVLGVKAANEQLLAEVASMHAFSADRDAMEIALRAERDAALRERDEARAEGRRIVEETRRLRIDASAESAALRSRLEEAERMLREALRFSRDKWRGPVAAFLAASDPKEGT